MFEESETYIFIFFVLFIFFLNLISHKTKGISDTQSQHRLICPVFLTRDGEDLFRYICIDFSLGQWYMYAMWENVLHTHCIHTYISFSTRAIFGTTAGFFIGGPLTNFVCFPLWEMTLYFLRINFVSCYGLMQTVNSHSKIYCHSSTPWFIFFCFDGDEGISQRSFLCADSRCPTFFPQPWEERIKVMRRSDPFPKISKCFLCTVGISIFYCCINVFCRFDTSLPFLIRTRGSCLFHSPECWNTFSYTHSL